MTDFGSDPGFGENGENQKPPPIYTIHDIPRPEDMSDYLSRVRAVRERLAVLPGTPDPPSDMEHLTFQAANDIELALLGVERTINAMEKSWFYSGEIQSGGF